MDSYTIPLKKNFDKPKRGRAKNAVKAVKNFVKKHKRLNEDQIAISKEVNEKIWARGMFGIPRKIEVILEKIENKTFVFLKEGTELKEMQKQKTKEKKKTETTKEEKKTETEIQAEKEKAKKLEEKRQKEKNAQKAEMKRKPKE